MYRKAPQSVRAWPFDFDGGQSGLSTWLADHVESRADVVSLQALLDVRATIRAVDGTLDDRWLSNVAHVSFIADTSKGATRSSTGDYGCPWGALLDIDVLSLFQRDNSSTLARGRERWKRLCEQDPTIRWDHSAEGSTLVTLATPPPGTPADNRELHAVNAPRLLSAVRVWEQRTEDTFRWDVHLDA